MATINAINTGTGVAGQVLTSNGAGVAPTFQGAAGNSRVNVTGATQAMATNTTYTTNDSGSLVTYTLPASANLGDRMEIIGNSAAGWTLAQNALQAINIEGITTTVGTGGSVSSTTAFDCITLICTVAGTSTRWTGVPCGNLTYV